MGIFDPIAATTRRHTLLNWKIIRSGSNFLDNHNGTESCLGILHLFSQPLARGVPGLQHPGNAGATRVYRVLGGNAITGNAPYQT